MRSGHTPETDGIDAWNQSGSVSRTWSFVGGQSGQFLVTEVRQVMGAALPLTERLDVRNEWVHESSPTGFVLVGVTSNERYVARPEKSELQSAQRPLGRSEANQGALIPIRKSEAWWSLPQDERRKIFEEDSRHIALGLRALPAVARRLHHCRDMGLLSPFDFLTWFDFAPEAQPAFDDLLGALRTTEEWKYVEREVEVRVLRAAVGDALSSQSGQ